MNLNELHQREIDSPRDENIELNKKVKELELKIEELGKDKKESMTIKMLKFIIFTL